MHLDLPAAFIPLSKLGERTNGVRFASAARIIQSGPTYRIDVTDGRVLGILRGATTIYQGSGPSEILVPYEEIDKLAKLIGKEESFRLETLLANQFRAVFATSMLTGKCLLTKVDPIDETQQGETGRFPNTDQVLPSGEPSMTFRVSAKVLMKLLAVVAKITESEHAECTFTIYDANKPIAVSCKNDQNGMVFDSLFVPLTEK